MRRAWSFAALLILVLVGLFVLGERSGWWPPFFDRAPAYESRSGDPLPARPPADPELGGTGTSAPLGAETSDPSLPPPVDLDAVDRAADLHGIVVRPDGTPVPGAEIRAVHFPWQRTTVLASDTYDEREEGPATLSALDGTFTLRLRPGTRASLEVRASGFAPLRLRNCQAGERVRVVLAPAVVLVVSVVDPTGKPLPAVDLLLRRHGNDGGIAFWYEGRTGDDGTYRFSDLPGGVSAGLEARQGPEGGWASVWSLPLPKTGEGQTEIVIPVGRLVKGCVTDARTGRPVEGARVGMGWTFFREARTDANGRYALGGWTGDGYHELHVRAAGYAAAQAAVGEAATIDFALEPGFAVEGRIVGEGAHALPRALVAAIGSMRVGNLQQDSRASGRSAESGRFRLEDLSRDLPHVLIAMAEGHGRTLVAFDAPPEGEATLDLGDVLLPAGRLVAGRVLDDAGQSLADVEVTLGGANDDVNRLRSDEASPVDSYYGRSEERRTDDLGRFAFADLAPGTYLLTAVRSGGARVSREIRLSDHADVTDVQLSFRPLRRFRVRVLDARGDPVTGALVNLEAWGADDRFEVAGDDGTAPFDLPLDVTQVRVHVMMGWGNHLPVLIPEPRVVAAADGEVEIVLADAALVRGHLLAPDGTPIVRGQVKAKRGGTLVDVATTEGDGGFVLRVPPGEAVDLAFEGDVYVSTESGGVEHRRRALVAFRPSVPADGERRTLRAEAVGAEEELIVRVVGSDGAPVVGATVRLQPLPAVGPGTRTAGADGTVRVEGLPARAWNVVVIPPQEQALLLAGASLSGVVPGEGPLTVRLEPPILLEGTVVDANGATIAQAQVETARHLGGEPIRVQSDVDGRFVLPVPPDLDLPMILRAYAGHGESGMLFAEVTGLDPHDGPVRVVLHPHRGW